MATLVEDIRHASTWSIVFSVMMMFAGILALFVPGAAGIAVMLVLGWLLILSGLLHIGFAWAGGRASAVIGELLIGALYGAVGIYLLVHPGAGLQTVTLAVAIYFAFEGILEFVLAYQLREIRGGGWLALDGLVTLLLAVMIVSGWPSSSGWALGTLVGISMFLSGLTRLLVSVDVRRITA